MRLLQIEHAAWIAKKYPNQTPKIPAVGCLEEAGELVHAILKIEQVHTWGEDSRHKLSDLRSKLVDAIGDCGIYACSLCNANEWDFNEEWCGSVHEECIDTLDAAIVLVKAAVEIARYPLCKDRLFMYLCQLKTVAHCLGLDAKTAVHSTWETVKCR